MRVASISGFVGAPLLVCDARRRARSASNEGHHSKPSSASSSKALQPDAAAPTGAASIGQSVTALRTLSLDQLVDVGISKLRTFVMPPSPVPQPLPQGTRVIRLPPPTPPRR